MFAIPFTQGDLLQQWRELTTPAQASFNNDSSFDVTYGRYYNWYVGVDPRGVCPCGWHMPDLDDFVTLRNTLGGNSVAGGKMKVTGFLYWGTPNAGATNSSGFSARGAGDRGYNGNFERIGVDTYFWSTTDTGWPDEATYWNIRKFTGSLNPTTWKKAMGNSIRCVAD